MADNVELNLGSGGKTIATDDIGGVQHELVKVEFGADGSATQVSAADPLPVTDAIAEAALASIAAEDFATQTTLAVIASAVGAPTTVLNGKTTVTTAGTRVVLAASTACKSVTIKALSTNTGFIYVGSSAVSSANGFQLSARESVSMDIANLNTVNIDSSISGEGVSYLGVN